MGDSEAGFGESLGQRIRALRGRKSRDAFARELGIHKNTLARYETSQRLPDAAFLKRLCDHGGVTPEWLLAGNGHSARDSATADDYIRPPLLQPDAGSLVSPMLVHRGWIDAQRLPAERLRLYVVEDDAMAPVIAPGEMLLVKLQRPASQMRGLYVLEMDGAYTVRRLRTADAGHIAVHAERPLAGPAETRHPVSAFQPDGACPLIGEVVWQVRAPE